MLSVKCSVMEREGESCKNVTAVGMAFQISENNIHWSVNGVGQIAIQRKT